MRTAELLCPSLMSHRPSAFANKGYDDKLQYTFSAEAYSPDYNMAQASMLIFTPIYASILRSIDPVKVAGCILERERYEHQVKLKATEVPSI